MIKRRIYSVAQIRAELYELLNEEKFQIWSKTWSGRERGQIMQLRASDPLVMLTGVMVGSALAIVVGVGLVIAHFWK